MKILTIVGARPQFIKTALLNNIFNQDKAINHKLLNTGQHYDFEMYESIFKSLKMKKPDFNLNIKNSENFLSQCIAKIELHVFKKFRPNLIITYGDTQSTLLASIIAKKNNCKLAHIESGLRSNNFNMPEEFNRFITDHLSDFLFVPNLNAKKKLQKEGIKKNIYVVGDVMYDIFYNSKNLINKKERIFLKKLNLKKDNYYFLTIHRNENTKTIKNFKKVINYIKKLKLNKTIIFLAHPRLKQLHKHVQYTKNFKIIKPVNYIETQILLKNSLLCLTDSGGLQKEAYFNKKNCLTLRNETEWTETIDANWNILWTAKKINYSNQKIIDYGNGDASKKIYKILKSKMS
jgi:UDP-GlcNAc3NAcA epimerase